MPQHLWPVPPILSREYRLSKSPSSVAEAIRHRERELEFYRLVAQQLFPLDEDMIEEWLMSDMGEYIPLALMGFDLGDDDLEDVKLPVTCCSDSQGICARRYYPRRDRSPHAPGARFRLSNAPLDVRRLSDCARKQAYECVSHSLGHQR